MFFKFNPWELEIDVEATKKLYLEENYSKDDEANREFIDNLTAEQKKMFEKLGVNLAKVQVDKAIYDIPEEKDMPEFRAKKMTVNFLMRGHFLAVPQYQADLYSDEDIFGKEALDGVRVLSDKEEDYLKVYECGIGAGIVFKHPGIRFDDERFEKWDCGYILGSILIMEEF